jgi:predicted ATP-grasp superfamily ATP-dependent carboligase
MAEPQGYELVLHEGADPSTLGGTAICGFTTAGMVGSIAAGHIVRALNLPQMGSVRDERFPAIALIQDSRPKHPVRVYQGDRIGVFIAEIKFPPQTDLSFGETVLRWFTEGGFDQLVIIDGVAGPELGVAEEGQLFGVAASEEARATLKKHGIKPIETGIVAGIPGYLLAEADRRGLDAVAVISAANPAYPDARAAALAVEAVSEIIDKEIPLHELLEDARRIEDNVRRVFEESQAMLPAPRDDGDADDDPMIL